MNSATLDFLQANRAAMTPAELAAALAADPVLVANIDRKALAAYLLNSGLFAALQAVRDDPGTPAPLAGGLQQLFYFLQWGLDYAATTDPAIAAGIDGLTGALVQAGVMTADQAAAIRALGGGYRYDRLTEQQVADALAALDAEAAFVALRVKAAGGYNAVVAAIDGGEADPAALAKVFAAGMGV